jgi:hypothetical protein
LKLTTCQFREYSFRPRLVNLQPGLAMPLNSCGSVILLACSPF